MGTHEEHIVGDGEIELSESTIDNLLPVTLIDHQQEIQEIEELEVNTLSPLELQIAEEKLNNVPIKRIGERLGISDKIVRIVLSRTKVKKYIKDIFDSVTTADKEMRMQLMAAMIEEKMATEGISSKLDLAQLIQMLDSMGKVKEQADVGSQGSVMINILNTLEKD